MVEDWIIRLKRRIIVEFMVGEEVWMREVAVLQRNLLVVVLVGSKSGSVVKVVVVVVKLDADRVAGETNDHNTSLAFGGVGVVVMINVGDVRARLLDELPVSSQTAAGVI